MIPYTTPFLTIHIKNTVDMTLAEEIVMTSSQGDELSISKSGEAVAVGEDKKSVSCWLTQEESARFTPGPAKAQCNWIYTDAISGRVRRAATKPVRIKVDQQLYKAVIT